MTIESTRTFTLDDRIVSAYLAATGVEDDQPIVPLSAEAIELLREEQSDDPVGDAWVAATTCGFAA